MRAHPASRTGIPEIPPGRQALARLGYAPAAVRQQSGFAAPTKEVMLTAQSPTDCNARPAGSAAGLRRVIGSVALTAAAMAVSVATGRPATAQPLAVPGVVRNAGGPGTIKDSYIVVFKNTVTAKRLDAKVAGLAARHGVSSV